MMLGKRAERFVKKPGTETVILRNFSPPV